MKHLTKRLVGKRVLSEPITGNETTAQLLEKAFGAYVGREVKNAYQIIRRMIEKDHTIVLALSGAMTPADFGVSCIIPLIKSGLVDIITTTGANLYHDLQRQESDNWYEVNPNQCDIKLRKAGWTRIYDTGFPEDDLWETDNLVVDLVRRPDFAKQMTTTEFHYLLGRHLARFGNRRFKRADLNRSILVQAYRNSVPIFCGAPQDGSIFLNLAFLKKKLGHKYHFGINLEDDIHEFGAYHYLAKNKFSKKLSIIILGGGVPKNYSLQPEPYLAQICDLDVGGYDTDVQICDAHVQNGGLSSCTASEAHTWGKTSEECVKNSQYVLSDVTAVFPFIVHALMQEGLEKEPRRLFDQREEAVALLDKALRKHTLKAYFDKGKKKNGLLKNSKL
ncbi:MAG: deoxyhypusine synthase family protein [Candidatus Portnoybacteria bacterium]|nr:deoxyhypusine synthase family protein [Candidatus Portnoybacteria bacterium]MDD4982454.1 deoxyhypusine synthase family protein [Candidatus Portnoybacteria bacterium]